MFQMNGKTSDTLQEGMRGFITYMMRLSGTNGKCPLRAGKRDWHGVFMAVRG